MNTKVLLLNGPNLNLLGKREPAIYGFNTLAEIERQVVEIFEQHNITCLTFQSNSEGGLIDWLHAKADAKFLIFNPGGFSHTSVALRDAILGLDLPFIELHISNVYKREVFRQHSYFSDIAIGVISGLGTYGYQLAAHFAIEFINRET